MCVRVAMASLPLDLRAIDDVLLAAREGDVELGKEVLDSLERMSWEEVSERSSEPMERVHSTLAQIASERNGFRGFFRVFPRRFGRSSQIIEELRGCLSQWLHGIGDGSLDDDEEFIPNVWPQIVRLLPSMACTLSCCSSRVSQFVGNSLTSWLMADSFDISSPTFEVRLLKDGTCTVLSLMEVEFAYSHMRTVELVCASKIHLDSSFSQCSSAVVNLVRILSPLSVKNEFFSFLKENSISIDTSAFEERRVEKNSSSETDTESDEGEGGEGDQKLEVPGELRKVSSSRLPKKKNSHRKQKEIRSMSVRGDFESGGDQKEEGKAEKLEDTGPLAGAASVEFNLQSRSSRFHTEDSGRWSATSRSSTLPERELPTAERGMTTSLDVPGTHVPADTQKWSSSKRPSAARPPRPSVTLGGANAGRSLGHSFLASPEGQSLSSLASSDVKPSAPSTSPSVSSQSVINSSSNSPPTSLKDLFSSFTNQIAFKEVFSFSLKKFNLSTHIFFLFIFEHTFLKMNFKLFFLLEISRRVLCKFSAKINSSRDLFLLFLLFLLLLFEFLIFFLCCFLPCFVTILNLFLHVIVHSFIKWISSPHGRGSG